ncbi:ATP-dependent zinc metalloprotease FtsH [Anaerosphaera multitolerans]|nr:ATP-dependent zinc metalloprotease FtsH [Anaerosphaera multitolerans]
MNRKTSGITFYLMLILLVLLAIRVFNPPATEIKELSFTDFVSEINSGNVKSIKFNGDVASYELKEGKDGNKAFRTTVKEDRQGDFYDSYLKNKVDKGEISIIYTPYEEVPFYITWIPTILMIAVFVFIWFRFIQQNQGGGSKMSSFGKSKARMMSQEEGKKVTFDDVAGLVEEKEELGEIVDFLKNPRKFVEMGARIPKGVLLVGPPGTGKTYLSKAVAGEAKVPFFIMSGSDFVEMFVGVGASRVRDLFENAKKNAPCIIFIDEIDAVGRRRGAGLGGGHDEREQTLNQLLVEMDGFGTNEGVIVMAATNRADILDPALLRPGRFDRTVYVGLPDVRGREEILKVHSQNKKLADDVDLKVISKRTPGFTPADLENLMNEAALLAARRNEDKIYMEDVNEASIKVQAGPEKKSKVVTDKERKLTAIHEAGHAVVSKLLPDTDPVHMITIIPRGAAGGFTAYIPEEDVSFITKKQMEARLVTLLGGRVAEQLVLDDISTGASNDIERATQIARSMVTEYGMSRLGTINFGSEENEIFVGRDLGRSKNYSEKTAADIDEEVENFINTAYENATKLLTENMDRLLRVSDALLEKETISGEEFEKLFVGEEIEKSEYDIDEKIEEEDLSEKAKEIISKTEDSESEN